MKRNKNILILYIMNINIPKKPTTLLKHGTKLHDDYKWMKTDKQKAVNVIKKLNKSTNKLFNANKTVQRKLANEFKNRIVENYETIPTRKNNFKYQYVIKKGENYGKYYCINGCTKKILFDCEKMAKEHEYWDMTGPLISKNEEKIVYSVDCVGNDENKIYFNNFYDNNSIEIKNPKKITLTNDFFLANDSNTLYYTTMNDSGRPNKIWVTKLDDNKNHKCIYTENDELYTVSISTTFNGDKALIYVTSNDCTEILLVENNEIIKKLFSRRQKALISIDYKGGIWYILFEKNNKTRMIYSTSKYIEDHKTWLPYKKDIVYEYFVLKGDYMILGTKMNGLLKTYVYMLCDNKKKYEIKFENPIHSISFPGLENMNKYENKIIINYENWLIKGKKIEINLENRKQNLINEIKIPGYNPDNYILERVCVKDKLLMTILRKKTTILTKGPHKCMFDGYGAYGSVYEAEFDIQIPSLLDRGFIYCITHIRGGGYYDTNWYKEGKMLKKMNTFHDFIACIDYMLDKKYTIPEKVAVFGRSAGGLLIGSVLNMAPEKIGLAVMGVPFVDIMNTMLDSKLKLTTGEYSEWGNPNKKKYFDYMLKYSPYDNIDLNKPYPNIYLYGNLNDSRVPYWEPLKYYAKIREGESFQNDNSEINIHINTAFGHSQSSERYQELIEQAKIYSIILHYIK